jgi:hypothetical protein
VRNALRGKGFLQTATDVLLAKIKFGGSWRRQVAAPSLS